MPLTAQHFNAIPRRSQAKAAAGVKLPFAIMTSGDTHDRTVALLESHNYFGMDRDQARAACYTAALYLPC